MAPLRGQNIIWIFNNLRCLHSRKVWWAVQIANFCQIRIDQRGDSMKTNFDHFKMRWLKKWGHLSSFHASFLSYGPYIVQKSVFSARILTLLKQFTYMDLKLLITVFQKIIWFIGVCATVHEILAIKISQKMLAQKFNKILRFQTPISPKL